MLYQVKNTFAYFKHKKKIMIQWNTAKKVKQKINCCIEKHVHISQKKVRERDKRKKIITRWDKINKKQNSKC